MKAKIADTRCVANGILEPDSDKELLMIVIGEDADERHSTFQSITKVS